MKRGGGSKNVRRGKIALQGEEEKGYEGRRGEGRVKKDEREKSCKER